MSRIYSSFPILLQSKYRLPHVERKGAQNRYGGDPQRHDHRSRAGGNFTTISYFTSLTHLIAYALNFQKFEKVYMKELSDKKCVSAKTQFEYGWCLIRSKYAADINNGIKIFEGLCKDNPEEKRDYIYYLAIAYARMKDYTTSQKYVKAFLEVGFTIFLKLIDSSLCVP